MNEGERFQRAFQDAAIGIALLAADPLGKYIEVNPTFCRMTGYSRDELLARDFQSITASQDIDKNLGQLQTLLRGGAPSLQLEKQYLRKDSTAFWARLNVSMVRNDRGTPQYFIVQIEDIDKRKQAEDALRKSEQKYRALIENSPDVIINLDRHGTILFINHTLPQYTVEGVIGTNVANYIPAEQAVLYKQSLDQLFEAGEPQSLEIDSVGPTHWLTRLFPMKQYGKVQSALVIASDITERRRAEEALRESGQFNQQVITNAREGIIVYDREIRYRIWNQYMEEQTGLREEEVLGKHPTDIFPLLKERGKMFVKKETMEGIQASAHRALAGETFTFFDVPFFLPQTGATGWNSVRYGPFRNAQGEIIGVIATVWDITERKRTEEALRQNEERLKEAVRASQTGIFDHDHVNDAIYWSPEQRRTYGFSPEEPITLAGFLACVHPDDRERIGAAVRKAHDPAGDGRFDVEHRIIRRDRSVRWVTTQSQTLFEGEGVKRRPVRTIGAVLDITERRRAEEALQESSQFNQQIIANAREGIIVYDRELRYLVWNPFMEEMTGLRAEKMLGKRPRDLPALLQQEHGKLLITKQAAEGIEANLKRAVTGETFTYMDVPMTFTQTGMAGWSSARYGPFRNAQGEIVGAIAIIRDITERKRLEEQLRHAQKLEAIGQLAGGVAHEFNNLLTAIIGNLDLAIRQMTPESDQHSTLTGALQAARRAAMLTQQLLTFSHRTPMDPQPQDLNSIAKEVVHLLRQTIDRRIQVSVRNGNGLWPVLADAGQMHQVIMNLCVNARDSLMEHMEDISLPSVPPVWEPRIVIASENVRLDEADCKGRFNVRPGEYVCLSVSDNGCGIDEEVRDHIFEPFFTTKEVGHGTGLGLAAVHGIVKLHEGWIDLSSTKNLETTFKIYLPRTHRTAVPTPSSGAGEGIARGTETILFIDDEASIRRLGQTILEHHGYGVLLAKNGEEALEVFQRERDRIKLVVLDLTMPRLSGRDVLKRLLRLNPKMRVLISSGHQTPTDANELQRLGMIRFVPKPYRPDDLAQNVRTLLDAPAPA